MKHINIAILFSGNGSNLENIAQFLRLDSTKDKLESIGLKVVITLGLCNNPNAYGLKRCENLGIPTQIISHKDYHTREAFDEAISEVLQKARIDLVVLAGFMRILGAEITKQFTIMNIHPSFLPLYKGAHAIRDSFLGSEDFGGVSVHFVDENLDSGEMVLQEKIPKIAGESLQDFEHRIHTLEYQIYPQALLRVLEDLARGNGLGDKTKA
ncbi:phosphoribosylglycinamide formyltransferase [uncultured Helicobacter sp.]|uniref:phosphoribosylglycinamide formyltransferase n=1 Tax=uncultured Helicobacter sp. TaxID=175537 RepID=UPI0027DD1C01|nr:phosphoribosylglycinamide formyltransferase [uncultured Helicobacter sp.]